MFGIQAGGWIIVAVIAVAAVVGAFAIYNGVKKLKRKISRATYGLINGMADVGKIAKAVSQIKPSDLKEEEGPKSVSGMTSLALPRIAKDFPSFDYYEAKSRAELVLKTYLQAITEQDAAILSEGYSELRGRLRSEINSLSSQCQKDIYKNVKIHETQIKEYTKTSGKCLIRFETSIEYYYYRANTAGTVISGDKDTKVQTKYNVDMIYIQDREKVELESDLGIGMNCPNCGAPLKMLGAKQCDYCGSGVTEINVKAWNFSDVREVRRGR